MRDRGVAASGRGRRHEYRWSGDRPWLVIPARPRMTPTHVPIASTNDFVVKFANVNGSGSASANELLAKAILRMGVPVRPSNIFPSNIQSLPTWYEVRVSARGWPGRRGGVDLMVSVNLQPRAAAVAGIRPAERPVGKESVSKG